MSTESETNVSLLQRVRSSDNQEAWSEFVRIYAPLIYSYGRKRNLQDADAADLTQDVMQIASRKMASFDYDSNNGSFRGWLLMVTLNRIRQLARKTSQQGTGRTSAIELMNQHPTPEDKSHWEQLSQQQLFRWAFQQIKPEFKESTWKAFQLTTIEQQSPAAVAEQLGVSTGAVYVSRSRVISRLKEKIAFATVES